MSGDKETKELLVGVNEISLVLIGLLKDGAQFEDFAAFFSKLTTDADFRAKVQAAYEGALLIPDEIKHFSVGDVIDLTTTQVSYIPKFIQAFKAA